MGSRGSAKKILKQYAKAERNARIEYIDMFTCKRESASCRTDQSRHTGTMSLMRNFRLAILVGILLTVAASIGIAIAYDGGINVPGLEIREGAGELIVSYADGYGPEEGEEIEPLELGYIPEGYELEYADYDDIFGEKYEEYSHVGTGDRIIIVQFFNKDENVHVSTYLSDLEDKRIGKVDVCVVKNKEYSVYIFRKEKILVEFVTCLPCDEVERMIGSLY